MRSAFVRLLVVAATFLWATACGRPEPVPQQSPPRNVIIVLVDTLRADHMSTYGYERETTPFIDRWASRAIVFERARSQASCTFPSVNSLMTSRYPEVFTQQGEGQFGIPEEFPAIAEILDANGYHTVAVSASHIVRATPSDYNPVGGFDRGFDTFVEGCVWRHGACLSARVERQLETLQQPFFLYIHYMEPHSPYQPPARFPNRFAGEYDGYDFVRNGDPNPIGNMLYDGGPQYAIGDRDIGHLVDLYDDEIRCFDGVFHRLIDTLENRGLLERTLVVLASDHGEEFLEHDHIKHCRGLWDTVTHVPLVLRPPGFEQGQRIGAAVGNIDILPTILDYLDIETSGFGFEGESLRPLIEGRTRGPRYAFSDVGRYRGVDDGRFHLILDGSENRLTLFDIGNDPLEQDDLYATSDSRFRPLIDALDSWLKQPGRLGQLEKSLAAARAKENELRALGYLE